MKKLLILMLVLGLASSANAVIITFSSPTGVPDTHGFPVPAIDVLPGTLVVVQIISDTAVSAGYTVSTTEATTSAAGYAPATGVGALNAGFDNAGLNNTGVLRNMMTNAGAGTPRYILIDRIVGGIVGGSSAIGAGQVLYQFEVLIPENAEFSDTWTITAAIGPPFVLPPPAPYSHMVDGGVVAGTVALTIHAVPEPATIALLGLGSMFLMRRRRK